MTCIVLRVLWCKAAVDAMHALMLICFPAQASSVSCPPCLCPKRGRKGSATSGACFHVNCVKFVTCGARAGSFAAWTTGTGAWVCGQEQK